jgi:Sulfotransferase family
MIFMKETHATENPGEPDGCPAMAATPAGFSDRLGSQFWPFDVEALCAKARRMTGLDDFGGPSVERGLSVLVDSLNREANLHPLGRFLMQTHLLDLLKTRLQLIDAWKRQPETVSAAPIVRPVFITGMPRSGSTFLHELLAADPALRAPRIWEVMFPVSADEPDRGWRDRRVWKAATCLWWFRRLAPEADAVYPMRARTPHECVTIHSYTLMSEEFISSCRIPSYAAFLRSSDMVPVYQWQKRFLQHLQQHRARRWILKAPDHVYSLEALFSVFPDAKVIQTHRDPLDVLKSTIHLTRVLHELYARPEDPVQLAARETRVLSAAIDRCLQFRDAHPELAERFVDVNYSDLTTDPLSVINQIYGHFDMSLEPEATRRIKELALHRSRYRGRRAVPGLADMGLDAPTLAGRFETYCRRFHIATRRQASH